MYFNVKAFGLTLSTTERGKKIYGQSSLLLPLFIIIKMLSFNYEFMKEVIFFNSNSQSLGIIQGLG